ncbi:MAG TPA: DoxX family protein [Pseudonocardia sp.]|nr:DoxX family protein [Pseudonocardia sp.]
MLVPLAATGLALTMVGAVIVHLRRKETSAIVPPIVLGVVAAVVAVTRFGPYPL